LLIIHPGLRVYELLIAILLLAAILGAFDGPLTVYLPELFKTNVRYSATTFGYNIGGAALGGMAPFILSTLLQFIHSPVPVLCFYLGILALLSSVMVVYHAWRQNQENEFIAEEELSA
jgi:MFS family permease